MWLSQFFTGGEGYALDVYGGIANVCSFLLAGRREGKTNMLRALEPTMKAETRTRRALEKCMFEREICLVLDDTDSLNELKG